MFYLLCLLICTSHINCFTHSDFSHKPRMKFKVNEIVTKRFISSPHHSSVEALLSEETVVSGSQSSLYFYNFYSPNQSQQIKHVTWEKCKTDKCSYNITVVQPTDEGKSLFLCGTNPHGMACCIVNVTGTSGLCHSTSRIQGILGSLRTFHFKEGEHVVYSEFRDTADLFFTYSGDYLPGLYKFSRNRLFPRTHGREEYYVGLLTNRGANVTLEDKVYAFHKEKNKDTRIFSGKWSAFVSQSCMIDAGGPKNNLQSVWTSKLKARLYCGDKLRQMHLSEIVDVVSVRADRWEDTKVYALFRNDWGVSAVCVYLMEKMDALFLNSPFKDHPDLNRDRKCVSDSKKTPMDILAQIRKVTDLEDGIEPESFFYLHHNYTHIQVDNSNQHMIVFLALNDGRIHKLVHDNNIFFLIAEYQLFENRAQLHSMIFDPRTKGLYVRTRSEMIQLNVNNCAQYGKSCVECNLANDPGCSWNGTACISEPQGSEYKIAKDNNFICPKNERLQAVSSSTPQLKLVSPLGMYYLECPVSSTHAQYHWKGPQHSETCNSKLEPCLLLLNNMTSEMGGVYTCEAEEKGHKTVVRQYRLEMSVAQGQHVNSIVWLCFITALIHSVVF